MKVFKGIMTFLFVVGVSFMITTLTFAVEHKHTFTEEIQSWSQTKDHADNEKIEIENNEIVIH